MIWFSYCILSLYFTINEIYQLMKFPNEWNLLINEIFLFVMATIMMEIIIILYVIFFIIFMKIVFPSYRNLFFIDWAKWADKRHRVSTVHFLWIHLLIQDSINFLLHNLFYLFIQDFFFFIFYLFIQDSFFFLYNSFYLFIQDSFNFFMYYLLNHNFS